MKIKRPLINQFYEEEDKEPEDPIQQPLERPSFAHIKPLEQANAENLAQQEQEEEQKEVVIQTRPSEEFLRWKAQQEADAKAKLEIAAKIQAEKEAEELEQENQRRLIQEARIRTQQYTQPKAILPEPALPKTAVRAEDMPQRPKVVKPAEVNVVSKDQLEFGILPKKPTFDQRVSFFKMYFERRQELLEISMLWKNPSLPFNIVSVIFVIGLLFIGGIFEFDKIPLKIPLFYNHVEKSWEQTDKSTVFIMGIILLITEGFLINLIIKIFKTDRRLALTLSWVITFINVLIIIAALQIYSLIT